MLENVDPNFLQCTTSLRPPSLPLICTSTPTLDISLPLRCLTTCTSGTRLWAELRFVHPHSDTFNQHLFIYENGRTKTTGDDAGGVPLQTG